MTAKFISSTLKEKDATFEQPLRPASFDQFIGQDKLKERLKIVIQAARERNEPMEHMLFFGPPGLGKTTLAYIIAAERSAGIKTTSGPAIERPAELAGVLTNLNEGDILFIDEIHRLSRVVEEYLYPAMEEFKIDIMIDQGPSARSVRLNIPPFTLVGATTRFGLLSSPLRSRFGIANRLDYYDTPALKKIVLRSAGILGVEVDGDGAEEIAARSRGTPRIANCLLRRVRDYAQVKADNRIGAGIAHKALSLLEVDEKGLDEMDKRILKTIIENFSGGPVGIETIAVAVGEEPETIAEVYEPYLIQQGYLRRTRSGRCATPFAYRHLKIKPPASSDGELFQNRA